MRLVWRAELRYTSVQKQSDNLTFLTEVREEYVHGILVA
jgi:hypothetical protein